MCHFIVWNFSVFSVEKSKNYESPFNDKFFSKCLDPIFKQYLNKFKYNILNILFLCKHHGDECLPCSKICWVRKKLTVSSKNICSINMAHLITTEEIIWSTVCVCVISNLLAVYVQKLLFDKKNIKNINLFVVYT